MLLRILTSIDSVKKDLRAEIELLHNNIYGDQDLDSKSTICDPPAPVYSNNTPMSDAPITAFTDVPQSPNDDEMSLTKKQKINDV